MIRKMLSLAFALVFWFPLFTDSHVLAQVPTAETKQREAAAAAIPKFTSRSQLVLVPVVVTGKNGEHVAGLTREAFKIEERGKVREATIFEEVKTVAPETNRRPMPEGRSNFDFGNAKNWRMTIVVMDMLNTPVLSQTEGTRQLMRYMAKSLQREEPTALFGLERSGLKQLHPFTTDTAVLIAALKKLQGQVSLEESNDQAADMGADMTDSLNQNSVSQSAQLIADFMSDAAATMAAYQQRESTRKTLTAMMQIAHAYAAIPGRKTLIWASGGFPFMIDDPQAFARMGIDMVEQYEETWRALVSADIAVYTVDITGLRGFSGATANFDASKRSAAMAPTSRASAGRPMKITYDKAAEKQSTLRAFSNATGGTACVNSNDLEKCFAHAVDDSRSYYLVGYYLPSDDQQPGWRKLKVKVNAPGTHARAREGFYVPPPADDSQKARERQIVEALRSPVEFTGVRMNVHEVPLGVEARPAPAGKSRYEFTVGAMGSSVTVDRQGGNAVDLTIVAVAFTADGKNKGQAEDRLAGKLKQEMFEKLDRINLSAKLPLELAPGKYDIRFAIRDNLNGEIGTVGYPLEVK